MKILLVDDEDGIREGLAALLRRYGHEVRTAKDCATAKLALAGDYDVLVTDWRLPDGVAGSFLGLVRCPALAVSGHPDEIGVDRRLAAILTKPVRPKDLLTAINAAAARSRAGAEGAPDLLPAVAAAVAAFASALPAGSDTQLYDDGVFATVVADLPEGAPVPAAPAVGDWSVARRGRRWRVAWRLGRDAHAADPADRAADSADPVHGNADAMPMRNPIGPRLPADLADLWSEP
ncbi:MAG: response regulator [Planctomycetes bacterium]|nr:response regulator [Planctomycetota bacterium]